jgi:hypothetical protein
MSTSLKQCKICLESEPDVAFARDRNVCRLCIADRQHAYYQERKAKQASTTIPPVNQLSTIQSFTQPVDNQQSTSPVLVVNQMSEMQRLERKFDTVTKKLEEQISGLSLQNQQLSAENIGLKLTSRSLEAKNESVKYVQEISSLKAELEAIKKEKTEVDDRLTQLIEANMTKARMIRSMSESQHELQQHIELLTPKSAATAESLPSTPKSAHSVHSTGSPPRITTPPTLRVCPRCNVPRPPDMYLKRQGSGNHMCTSCKPRPPHLYVGEPHHIL